MTATNTKPVGWMSIVVAGEDGVGAQACISLNGLGIRRTFFRIWGAIPAFLFLLTSNPLVMLAERSSELNDLCPVLR